jgi:hypothetical protein
MPRLPPRSGQAMAEYAIILALVTALGWLERLPDAIAANPLVSAGVAAAVLLVLLAITRA